MLFAKNDPAAARQRTKRWIFSVRPGCRFIRVTGNGRNTDGRTRKTNWKPDKSNGRKDAGIGRTVQSRRFSAAILRDGPRVAAYRQRPANDGPTGRWYGDDAANVARTLTNIDTQTDAHTQTNACKYTHIHTHTYRTREMRNAISHPPPPLSAHQLCHRRATQARKRKTADAILYARSGL